MSSQCTIRRNRHEILILVHNIQTVFISQFAKVSDIICIWIGNAHSLLALRLKHNVSYAQEYMSLFLNCFVLFNVPNASNVLITLRVSCFIKNNKALTPYIVIAIQERFYWKEYPKMNDLSILSIASIWVWTFFFINALYQLKVNFVWLFA